SKPPLSAPSSASAPTSPPELEDEIGQALDSMFSESKPGTPDAAPSPSRGSRPPVVIGPSPLSGPGSPFEALNGNPEAGELTQISTSVPSVVAAATSAASAPPSSGPRPVEWFIAVHDEQVGPMGVEEIKQRFEKGEVGADTLVWSTGLTDWRPLSNVEELAETILP